MALLTMCGFEAQSIIDIALTGGTLSHSTSVFAPGGSGVSLRTNPVTTAVGHITLRTPAASGIFTTWNAANLYAHFMFRYDLAISANDEIFYRAQTNGGNIKLELRLNSSGQIVVYNSVGTVLATGSTVLTLGTWYRIEILTGTGAAATWQLKINNILEASGTGNLHTTASGQASFGKRADSNGNSVDFYFDDCWLDSAAYPGNISIVLMRPEANGSTMQWTAGTGASDYTQVDEIPPNTSDYVMAVAQNDVALFDFPAASTKNISSSIKAVGVSITTRGNAATGSIMARLFSGATASDTTSTGNDTSSKIIKKFFETDPDTASAWTTSGVDAVEGGGVDTHATNRSRINCVWLDVAFIPSASELEHIGRGIMRGVGRGAR